MEEFSRDSYTEIDEEDDLYLKPKEILEKIEQLEDKTADHLLLRDQALIAILYLGAMRIAELVYYVLEPHKDKDGDWVIEEKIDRGNPIRKRQIEDCDAGYVLIHNVRCLKRTKKSGKEQGKLKRNIPINKWRIEKPFFEYLFRYLDTLDDEKLFLFPFTRQRAWKILNKVGLRPHQLRHLRLTHLTTTYWFSPNDLKKYVGWTNIAPSSTYVHLDTTDLVKKMQDRAKQIEKEEEERGF